MKRKVQAQRKFAQGAPIPPNNNIAVERRLEVTAAKEGHRAIFHNKTSANNLLDIVSFQNMHSHKQPIVLLKRLQTPPSTEGASPCPTMQQPPANPSVASLRSSTQQASAIEGVASPCPSTASTNFNYDIRHNYPPHILRKWEEEIPSNEPVASGSCQQAPNADPMSDDNNITTGRNGSGQLRNSTATTAPKSNKRKRRAAPTSHSRPARRKNFNRKQSECTTSSLDDNQPLKYFMRTREPKAVEKNGSQFRAEPSTSQVNEESAAECLAKAAAIAKQHSQARTRKHVAYKNEQVERWLSDSLESERRRRIERTHKDKDTFKMPRPMPNKNDLPSSSTDEGNSLPSSTISAPRSTSAQVCNSPESRIDLTENESADFDDLKGMCQAASVVLKKISLPHTATSTLELDVPSLHSIETYNEPSDWRILPQSSDGPRLLGNGPSRPQTVDVYEFEAENEVISQVRSMRHNSQSRNADAMRDTPRYLDLPNSQKPIVKVAPNNSSNNGHSSYHAESIKQSNANDINEDNNMRQDLFSQLLGDIGTFSEVPIAENFLEKEVSSSSGPEVAGSSQQPQPALSASPDPDDIPERVDHSKPIIPPTFHPTEAEFTDPIAYFEKIMPEAAKFGVVKVVAPANFKPSCHVGDDIRFNVSNQYLGRMYCRWTPAAREMCTIKAYVASQGVHFTRAPLVDGLEINLPKLYHLVQRHGGLKKMIQKKRWSRIAEEMHLTKRQNPVKKLDQVYVKYLLPYDTMSNEERKDIIGKVDRAWYSKNQRMLERALNPLHRQRRLLGESDSSEEDPEDEGFVCSALAEAEDCVVSGRNMKLATFKKIAAHAMDTHFPESGLPTMDELEEEYWRLVLLGTDHVCVNTASIDTGEDGYGFSKEPLDPYSRHPWNLKMISQNSGNVLRSLGPVLGVTVPTLHVGMVFATSCWHRDPHGLPWVEYMHSGPGKLWYGIPNEESDKFCTAVERLCPTSRQNKSIWLPSDIVMIPPKLLLEQHVSISKVEQLPGEFVIVFPKAYSSSVSRGYTHSESVYFATNNWLSSVHQTFQGLRESCEPTMFALEQLLIAIASDRSAPLSVLQQVFTNLEPIVMEELKHRQLLVDRKVAAITAQNRARPNNRKRPSGAWNVRDQDECEICRTTLYLSKVVGLSGKKSSLCLQHALRVLDQRKIRNAQDCELVAFYTERELNNIIMKLQATLSASAT